MSKEVTPAENLPVEKPETILTMLVKMKPELSKALGEAIDIEQFARIAVTEIKQNSKLMDCKPLTLMAAIMQAAQLGLRFDKMLGHAYLIPYNNECSLQLGYRGMITLAHRWGVREIITNIVYSNEHFKFKMGPDGYDIEHDMLPPSERGEFRACYSIAYLDDNHRHKVTELMWAEEVYAIRDKHSKDFKKNKEDSLWVKFEADFIKKTVIRKMCKRIPIAQVQQAAVEDEAREFGYDKERDVNADVAEKTASKAVAMQKRLENAKAKRTISPEKAAELAADISDEIADNLFTEGNDEQS